MPRFFVERDAVSDGVACISGADARHIARALRMAVGEEITVCSSDGTEYACRLSRIRDEQVLAEVLSEKRGESESPVRIHLYMAYPKGDKLEFVIEKAVELGAATVTPFLSSRCVRRPAAEKTARLTERYERIARAAAGQCGRALLPRVFEPLGFEAMLREATARGPVLFCYEGEGTRAIPAVLSALKTPPALSVVIGAEGGFSPEEVKRIEEASLQVAKRLGEVFEKQEEEHPFPFTKSEEQHAPVSDVLTEKSAATDQTNNQIAPPAGEDRLLKEGALILLEEGNDGFLLYARAQGLLAPTLLEKINEWALDAIGDVAVEQTDEGYSVIEDYKEEITAWINS
jgi:16S rRNA (uracil1498-N3)-methyltransferase